MKKNYHKELIKVLFEKTDDWGEIIVDIALNNPSALVNAYERIKLKEAKDAVESLI